MRCIPVIEEFLIADIGQRMLKHLGYHAKRHGCNIGAHSRSVDDVYRTTNACHEDFGVEIIVLEDLNELSYQLHADMADIIEAAHKRAQKRGSCLCGDYRLRRRKHQGHINVGSFTRQDAASLYAIRSTRHFDVDIGVNLGQVSALIEHLRRSARGYFGADRSLNNLANSVNVLL